MKQHLLLVSKIVFCLAVVLSADLLAAAEERPNIIVILVDDLGYGELGCQGNPEIPTPNIDSIAQAGVRFTQGYVTASYCSQSRAGLLTGRHQIRFGYTINPTGAQNDDPKTGLPLDEATLAEYLRDHGYVTGLFGKWHLGATSKYLPLRRGFDEFYGFLHEGHYYVPPPYHNMTTWLRRKVLPKGGKGTFVSRDQRTYFSTHMGHNEPVYDANNPILRGGQPVEEQEHLTDAITREAKIFIRRNIDKPFFALLSYNAVHSPMQGADRYVHKYRNIRDPHRRIFAAMLSNLDDSVGEILATVQQTGVLEKTMIVFLSDNGGPTKELTSSNRPLRGEKGSLYEGGVRVPFLIQWKNRIRSGSTFKQPVSSLDVFATIQQLTGFKVDAQKKHDGTDLMPYLAGSKTGRPHENLFWKSSLQMAVRSGDWKIIQNLKDSSYELFDLASDLSEQNNLADSESDRLERMKSLLDSVNSEMTVTSKGQAEQ